MLRTFFAWRTSKNTSKTARAAQRTAIHTKRLADMKQPYAYTTGSPEWQAVQAGPSAAKQARMARRAAR